MWIPIIYLFANHFGEFVRVHRVDFVHVELEHEVPAPVAAADAVHGEAHGVEHVVHLLHPGLLEYRPYRDLNPATGRGGQHRRGKEYEFNHYNFHFICRREVLILNFNCPS